MTSYKLGSKMSLNNNLLLLGCGLLFACSAEVPDKTQHQALKQDSKKADFYMQSVKRVTFNQEGKIDSRLSAEQVYAYRDPDMSEWVNPNFFVEKDGQHWKIAATKGIHKNKHFMTLEGAVEINSYNHNKVLDFNLKTEQLLVDFKSSHATSSLPVNIVYKNGKMNASTLWINFKNGGFKFSNPKGYYEETDTAH